VPKHIFSIKKINQIYPGKRADNFLENERLGTTFFSGINNKFRLGKDIFFIGEKRLFIDYHIDNRNFFSTQNRITTLIKIWVFKPIIFLLPQKRPIKGVPSYKRSK